MTPLAGPAASGMSAIRLLDMPFCRGSPYTRAVAIVVAFPRTGFSSFAHLCACPPPMRVVELLNLTRPGGLVARRYGLLDDTRPHARERLHQGAASPPLLSP